MPYSEIGPQWSASPHHLPLTQTQIYFFSILCVSEITKDRCSSVLKYYAEHGVPRPERRGGARRVAGYDEKKQAVVEHISSFTC